MAIKAVARRPWGDAPPSATSWYEPWTAPDDVAAGVRFALSTPGIAAFCTPGDLAVLTTALDAAEAVAPLTQDERASAMAAMAGEEVIFPLQEKARQ
jgi:hypothetical protein